MAIDAVAQVQESKLFCTPIAYARVEFKHTLQANRAIGHFFDAIDAIVCWSVASTGPLPEAGDSPVNGELRKRAKPRLASGLDAYEVVQETGDVKRLIPALALDRRFGKRARG